MPALSSMPIASACLEARLPEPGVRKDGARSLLENRSRALRRGNIAGWALAIAVVVGTIAVAAPGRAVAFVSPLIASVFFWYEIGASFFHAQPRVVLLLRRFRRRSQAEFLLARELGVVCRGLAVPVTVQDDSFQGDLPIALRILHRGLPAAALASALALCLTIALLYPEFEFEAWQMFSLTVALALSLWLGANRVLRSLKVLRTRAGRQDETLDSLVRDIRRRPWTYSGTNVAKFPDASWQSAIEFLSRRADAAVIDVSDISPSVAWEIRTVFHLLPPEAILLCSVQAEGSETGATALPAGIAARLAAVAPDQPIHRCLYRSYPRTDAPSFSLTEPFACDMAACLAAGARPLPAARLTLSRVTRRAAVAVLALICLAASLLGIRRFWDVRTAARGFEPNQVVAFTLDLGEPGAPARQLIEAVREVPGAVGAAVADELPAAGNGTAFVTGGYFSTFRIPVLRGRSFVPEENGKGLCAAVVSMSVARREWPDRDPLGRTLATAGPGGSARPCEVVGVVGDIKRRKWFSIETVPMVYLPLPRSGSGRRRAILLVRAGRPSASFADSVSRTLASIRPAIVHDGGTLLRTSYRFR